MPCVHTISYPTARKDLDHALKPFMRRDFCATCDILFPLHQQGYTQGEQIFQPEPPRVRPRELTHVDTSFVKRGDKLVMNTRLPMNDEDEGPRKQIKRAYTDLEDLIFEVAKPFILYSSRTQMKLGEQMYPYLRSGYEDRREMKFLQNAVYGPYCELNAKNGKGWHEPEGARRTPLFLLVLDEAWKDGPGLICAFGMDGCATQVWCYLLARKYPHLLKRPGFYVAELEIGAMPEQVTDLRWSKKWKLEFVLEHDLGGRSEVA